VPFCLVHSRCRNLVLGLRWLFLRAFVARGVWSEVLAMLAVPVAFEVVVWPCAYISSALQSLL